MHGDITAAVIGMWAIFIFQVALQISGYQDPFLAGVLGIIALGLFGVAAWELRKPSDRLSAAINRIAELRQEGNTIIQMCYDTTIQDSTIQQEFEAWTQRIREFLRGHISIGAAMESRLGNQQNVQFLQFGSSVRSTCYNTTILYQANLDVFIREMGSGTWAGKIL